MAPMVASGNYLAKDAQRYLTRAIGSSTASERPQAWNSPEDDRRTVTDAATSDGADHVANLVVVRRRRWRP